MKGNRTPVIVLLIFLALFTCGVVKLFLLRFERGDVYPTYSSLRVDPLGTKAFCDSLKNLQHLSVSRNYRSFSKLSHGPKGTVLYLGVPPESLRFVQEDLLKAFDGVAEAGGRLIVSFFPVKEKPLIMGGSESPCSTHGKGEGEKGNERTHSRDFEPRGCKSPSLGRHWGFRFDFDERPRDLKGHRKAWKAVGENLPNSISWHTALYFYGLDNPWRVIYTCDEHPVVIERELGRGTIVLCADSYLFSNEALREERQSRLLAWFIGTHTHVVFDETHLGVRENPGIASLARKYHLHGLVLGIVLLGGLFVWKNTFHFVPPREFPPPGSGDSPSERDYTAGFVSLLRRNISPRDILQVCFHEWEKALPPSRENSKDKRDRAQRVVDAHEARPAKQRNPVEAYQTIQRILAERK